MAKLNKKQREKFQQMKNTGDLAGARAYRREALGKEKGNQNKKAPAPKKNRPLKNIKDRQIRQDIRGDIAAENREAEQQIKYGNADVTTAFGSSSYTYNPETGKYEYTETLSDPQQDILNRGQTLTQTGQDLAQKQLNEYQKFGMTGSPEERQRIEEAVFGRLTRDVEMNRGRDLESKKQELYNQGIPYSDDPNSRYQKEIGDIQRRYDDQLSNARGQAVEMGGTELERSYGMGLKTHQQGMSDITNLQGQGTGLQVFSGPGFSGGGDYNITAPSDIRAQREGEKIQYADINARKDIAAKQLAMDQAQIDAANQPPPPPPPDDGLYSSTGGSMMTTHAMAPGSYSGRANPFSQQGKGAGPGTKQYEYPFQNLPMYRR